jgi:hypothetical protein
MNRLEFVTNSSFLNFPNQLVFLGVCKAPPGLIPAALQEIKDTRTVSIGFNYRFSKGKVTTQKKRAAGSANEEQDRIGGN